MKIGRRYEAENFFVSISFSGITCDNSFCRLFGTTLRCDSFWREKHKYVNTNMSTTATAIKLNCKLNLMSTFIDLTQAEVWDDWVNYSVSVEGNLQLLSRWKCGFEGFEDCNQTTQLELCHQHLLETGLLVNESELPDGGWELFSTIDREIAVIIAYFTRTNPNRQNSYVLTDAGLRKRK
jgi:hypothetical protein